MLELLGREYVIDHCVQKIAENGRKMALETYLTDALKVITENTANAFGGKAMSRRFTDLFKPEETRSADDIISGIKGRLEGVK